MDPVDLLGDVAALRAADRAALLPAVATAGAQLRSTAGRVSELLARVSGFAGFEAGSGSRPRAVVILCAGRAAVDAELAVSLLGPRCPVPIVVNAELPAWVGALDVVVVLAGDAQSGGGGFAEAVQVARRRGAAVLVRAAADGEMAYAAGPSLLVPAIGVPESLAGGARLAVILLVASACGLVSATFPADQIELLADLLDAESLSFSPQVDTFVNPAKTLALHLMAGAGIFIGADPVGNALAAHGAWTLSEVTGRPSVAYSSDQISQAPAVVTALTRRQDPFADPFDELDVNQDGLVEIPSRPVIVRGRESDPAAGSPASWAAQSWYSSIQNALPTAIMLDGPEMVLPLRDSGMRASGMRDSGLRDPGMRDPGRGEGRRPDFDRRSSGQFQIGSAGPRAGAARKSIDPSAPRALSPLAADWAASALVMLRLDFAAVYVGLLAGQPIPIDAPAGLGAHAGSRDLLRPDTVMLTTHEQEDFDRWN